MILVYCCSTTKILPGYLSDLLICLIIYYPKIQLSFAYQTLNKNFNCLKFQEACPTTNTLYPTWILKPLRLTFKTVHVGSCMGLCFLFYLGGSQVVSVFNYNRSQQFHMQKKILVLIQFFKTNCFHLQCKITCEILYAYIFLNSIIRYYALVSCGVAHLWSYKSPFVLNLCLPKLSINTSILGKRLNLSER